MAIPSWPLSKAWKWIVGVFGTILILLVLYYILCLNHTSVNQVGICYNSLDGTISMQMKPGWYTTSPFVRVAYITTLPIRVTVTSDARVIVSKMVRFKPEGVDEFIRLQGFSYFTNIENTFLGYAYSGNTYLFLEIIQEPKAENSSDLLPIYKK